MKATAQPFFLPPPDGSGRQLPGVLRLVWRTVDRLCSDGVGFLYSLRRKPGSGSLFWGAGAWNLGFQGLLPQNRKRKSGGGVPERDFRLPESGGGVPERDFRSPKSAGGVPERNFRSRKSGGGGRFSRVGASSGAAGRHSFSAGSPGGGASASSGAGFRREPLTFETKHIN